MSEAANSSTTHAQGRSLDVTQDEPPAEVQDQSASGWLSRNGFRIGSIALSILSATFLVDALSSGIGQISNPGPGLWPAIASTTALVCSIISIFLSNAGAQKFTRSGSTKVAVFILLLFTFALLVEPIGFLVPSVILLFGTLFLIAREKLLLSVLMAVGLSLVTYLVFGELLSVRVPAF